MTKKYNLPKNTAIVKNNSQFAENFGKSQKKLQFAEKFRKCQKKLQFPENFCK